MNLLECLTQQKIAAKLAPTDADVRVKKLKALRRQIERYQDVFADAVSDDFGGRDRKSVV